MNTDPLAELRDIHLPQAIGTWPPAIGWWILLLTLIFILGFISYYHLQKYQRSRYRRTALKMLQSINNDYQMHKNTKQWLNDINRLLKRTCMKAYPYDSGVELSGIPWLNHLDAKLNSRFDSKIQIKAFTQPELISAFVRLFKPGEVSIDAKTEKILIDTTKKWIKKHQ